MVIAAIALIVIGPKDLPMVLRKIGQFVGRLRNMANDFRSSFDEMARQSELDDLRREVAEMRLAAETERTAIDTTISQIDGSMSEIDSSMSQIDREIAAIDAGPSVTDAPAPPVEPAQPLESFDPPAAGTQAYTPYETPAEKIIKRRSAVAKAEGDLAKPKRKTVPKGKA